MIGVDTAKFVFRIHGVNGAGKVEIRRKLRRNELIAFFEQQESCSVVIEAYGAAHHWARMLAGLVHTVKLIAAETVKPFVKKGKILALHAGRSLLVKQQTMLANAIRGVATEFGITVPKGLHKLEELMTLVDADEAIPKSRPNMRSPD